MQPLRLTRRQSREVDRIAIEEYGLPGLVLMENAAAGILHAVPSLSTPRQKHDRTVIILCGKGNNGGDGLAVARQWAVTFTAEPVRRDIRVLLTDPPEHFSGDSAVQLRVAQRMGLPIEPADAFLRSTEPFGGTMIDAVYGTGFRPPSRIDFRPLNRRVVAGGGLVFSIDLPSGMDADTGEVVDGNAVVARWTLTMGTEKAGFANAAAAAYLGQVRVVNLKIPSRILDRAAASPA